MSNNNRIHSGKVKKIPSANVSSDRYEFLSLGEAEPDLGLPEANNYVLVSDTDGNRTWTNSLDIQGLSGFSGISGYSGISGFSGDSGISGFSGDSGISGFSGQSGFSGYSGISGFSGYSGASGFSGKSIDLNELNQEQSEAIVINSKVASLMPYLINENEKYLVPANTQALFNLPIEINGILEVDGILVQI